MAEVKRHNKKEYLELVKQAIEDFQDDELMSDRDLSKAAGMSPTMVSKIKKWTTLPKLSTLKKLRDTGVQIPRPPRYMMHDLHSHKVAG